MLALALPGALLSLSASAAQPGNQPAAQPTSAHVHQQVGLVRNDIELIRSYLGKRGPRERKFRIAEAEPRQVYFQAQTLFRKCNHLALDYGAASRQIAAPLPDGEVSSADVQQLIRAAHEQILAVKHTLGITTEAPMPRLERRRRSADVLHGIVEAGNVLNRLIDDPADWTSIYDRVVQMLTYIGGALPESSRYPTLAAYECCAQPEDVYLSLAGTMRTIAPAAESVGLPLVKIQRIRPPEGGASTATVYDLTTTMVADIGEISLRLEGSEDVQPPSYARPTRILPAHALQLSRALAQQVSQLNAQAAGQLAALDTAR